MQGRDILRAGWDRRGRKREEGGTLSGSGRVGGNCTSSLALKVGGEGSASTIGGKKKELREKKRVRRGEQPSQNKIKKTQPSFMKEWCSSCADEEDLNKSIKGAGQKVKKGARGANRSSSFLFQLPHK